MFKVVVVPCLECKAMEYNIAVIEDAPGGCRGAIYAEESNPDGIELFLHSLTDSAQMRGGIPRCQDEEIGKIAYLPDIENHNILRFFLGGNAGDFNRLGFRPQTVFLSPFRIKLECPDRIGMKGQLLAPDVIYLIFKYA